MRRFRGRVACLLGALLALPAAAALADRFWTLQLAGGSVVLAIDRPEERGPTIVFHRHPDALFSSVRTRDVLRITVAEGPARKPKPSIEGQVLITGRDADPPEQTARAAPPPEPRADSYGDDSGGYGIVAYGAPHRHRKPPRPPSPIGPNGYPILAPPGYPGSTPPSIGPNGYPILSVTPPPRMR